MQFPSQSETFACSDIRVLLRKKVDVKVYSYIPAHCNNISFKDRRLPNNINMWNQPLSTFFSFLFFLFHRIDVVIFALSIPARELKNSFREALKELLLVPSALFGLYLILRTSPDVVHLYWGHYPSILGLLVKKYAKGIAVTQFLGAYDLFKGLYISRRMAKFADVLFTHARFNLSYFTKYDILPRRVSVIHRGVDLSYFDAHSIAQKKNKLQIVIASRLIKNKNIDAAISLMKELPDHRLIIAGSGIESKRLCDLTIALGVVNRCNFVGFIDQTSLFQRLQCSQFSFLFSTKKGECIPNSVKEAMLAGCICFVLWSPGIDELINHGQNGFIIKDLDDIYLIPDIICNLSEKRISAMSQAAISTIVSRFNANDKASCYINEWKDLCLE